jgi:hypothetical protein
MFSANQVPDADRMQPRRATDPARADERRLTRQGQKNRFGTSASRFRVSTQDAATTLAAIFEGIDTLATRKGRRAVITVGPESRIKAFYGARVFQSDGGLLKGIEQPEKEIGPPPFNIAAAGTIPKLPGEEAPERAEARTFGAG